MDGETVSMDVSMDQNIHRKMLLRPSSGISSPFFMYSFGVHPAVSLNSLEIGGQLNGADKMQKYTLGFGFRSV